MRKKFVVFTHEQQSRDGLFQEKGMMWFVIDPGVLRFELRPFLYTTRAAVHAKKKKGFN
jgi:hypothetical protein